MGHGFHIDNTLLTAYDGQDSVVTVPEYIRFIDSLAFLNQNALKKVILPDELESIGHQAFNRCYLLREIIFGDRLLDVAADAFADTLWYRFQPDGVLYAGNTAFGYKGPMSPDGHIAIREGTLRISSHAFAGLQELKSVFVPESVISVGECAFEGCVNLEKVEFHEGLSRLGSELFTGCHHLGFVLIPKSTTDISPSALRDVTTVCYEGSPAFLLCQSHHYSYLLDYQAEHMEDYSIVSSPFSADEEKPYVFVSYSHLNRERVFDSMTKLYEMGWRLWYDEGLNIGENYDEILEQHVRECSAFLYFVTQDSVKSRYVREYELPWAVRYQKPIIPCILDEGIQPCIPEDANLAVSCCSDDRLSDILERIPSLQKGPSRIAEGISVFFNPLREQDSLDPFSYCIYSDIHSDNAKYILHEASLAGCRTRHNVVSDMDSLFVNSCTCLVVFLDDALVHNTLFCQMLQNAMQRGTNIAVYSLDEFELPLPLLALKEKHWLKYDATNEHELINKLIGYFTEWGCRDTSVLPGFDYELQDGSIILTRYTGGKTSLTIDPAYGGHPVVAIADGTFTSSKMLQEVILPEGLKRIGDCAFSHCNELLKVVLPKSLRYMGSGVFEGCTALEFLEFPDLEEIPDRSFSGCISLSSFRIPDSVVKIGDSAFLGCKVLEAIDMPDSVREIGQNLFDGCARLRSVSFSNQLTLIPSGAFNGCFHLVEAIIPPHVTVIAPEAFSVCQSLCKLLLPEGLTSIGTRAFYGCMELSSVEFPLSLIEIGDGAFLGCDMLSGVVIPKNVSAIGQETFSVSAFRNDFWVDPGNAFFEIDEGILINTGHTRILSSVDKSLPSGYTVLHGVTVIDDGAFSEQNNLVSLLFPDTLTSIGKHAFQNCSRLTDIRLPSTLSVISEMAFYKCVSLHKVVIPMGVHEIGFRAFCGCEELWDLYVPYSVWAIGDEAFHDCPCLTVHCSDGSRTMYFCEDHRVPFDFLDAPSCNRSSEAGHTSLPDGPSSHCKGLFGGIFSSK